jgi:FAD/FMN-containing dehydrogenase
MSKIGAYLQEHISGEVSLSRDVRESMSRDNSVLKIVPEMVIYPKDTNDIRKVARFAWQLAERGHVLPITARGSGGDLTGAAIGSGVVLSLTAHMNQIFEYEPKQRLVRLQPGAMATTLSTALGLQDVRIAALPEYGTAGGAVAGNARSALSGRYGSMGEWVDRLEVVLANGEVIQTSRLNKRELGRKKGLGTLEGEIYRSIDNLIEDNKELVARLAEREIGTAAGYSKIALVKRKDGSFDLTPLLIGSQGTLGIISEMILKTVPLSPGISVIVASFNDAEIARDTAEMIIAKERPAFLESYDSALFEQAAVIGKTYNFLEEAGDDVQTVLVIGYDDNKRSRHAKKTCKLLDATGAWYATGEDAEAEKLLSLRDALVWAASPDRVEFGAPSMLGGAYIPPEGVGVFRAGLKTLSKKHSVKLPVSSQEIQSLYYVWPALNFKKSGDKQKMVKLLDDYAKLVQKVNGELVGADAEGRLKSRFALNTFDDETLKLFTSIKEVFDPLKTLNPGVKQMLEIKDLLPMIQNDRPLPPAGSVPQV